MKKTSCAERIREALKLREMTQADLCRATEISTSTMSQYVSGKYEPSQLKTELIARALNVNEAWLMGYDVTPERKGAVAASLDALKTGVPVTQYISHNIPLDEEEFKILSKYRRLDEHGKKIVNTLIDIELERCNNSKK